VASQRSNVAPFLAMQMAEFGEAHYHQTGELFGLHVGQPVTGAPRIAREAAAAAVMMPGPLGYTTSLGMPALRDRLSQWYSERHDVLVERERVLITAGASGAFVVAFLACFDAGARVGVTEPGYPCYRNDLEALGITAVPIPVGPETRWAPTPELLKAAGPLDGLIVASPANPTGTIIEPTALGALVRWCTLRGIRLISDEIYHGISYEGIQTSSALETSSEVVVINSFSKYFGMTGWRVGWIVAPPDIMEACERLHGNLAICAPHVSQVAALAAFDAHDELQMNHESFVRKRSLMIEGMKRAGLDRFAPPDGAFYLYTDVSHLGIDSIELCRRWLNECSVLVTPGHDFDRVRGGSTVRFSFAGSDDTIREACSRLGQWMANHP
jgi:aspartate/methionine/tyrosine aminotransferase